MKFLTIAGVLAVAVASPAAPRKTVLDGVHVVDVASGDIQRDRRVVLEGSRIAAILDRASATPADAWSLMAHGRFLVPGLWDMHVHIGVEARSEILHLPLFVAWGVTGVVDMGDNVMGESPPSSEVGAKRRWSEEALAGVRVGPRILGIASHGLNGQESGDAARTPEWAFLEAATEDDARRLARWLKDEMAVDFAKMYDGFPRATYPAFMAEARRIGLPVRGHKPLEVTFEEVVAAGQQSIEHMQAIPWESTPSVGDFRGFGRDRARGLYSPEFMRAVVTTMDLDRTRAHLELARAAGMYLTPTHITRKFEAMAATANQEFLDDERLELVPSRLREWWQADVDRTRARASSAGVEKEYLEFWRMGYRVTRMAVDSGPSGRHRNGFRRQLLLPRVRASTTSFASSSPPASVPSRP